MIKSPMEISRAHSPSDVSIVVYNVNRDDPKFNDYLCEELHVRAWLAQKRSKATRRNYEREVRVFFKMFPGILIKEISDKHIAAFIVSKRSLSLASQAFAKHVISSLLQYCVNIRYITFNFANSVDKIVVPSQMGFRSLSKDQVAHLLECASKRPLRDFLITKTLFYTGMRVSELISMKWGQTLMRTNHVQVTIVGKGAKSRSILISKENWAELRQLAGPSNDKPDAPVFTSFKRPSKGISATTVWRVVKSVVMEAKLPIKVSPHFLRHAHAVLALEGGVKINTLQKSLGHASLSTTGIYLDAFPNESSGEFLPVFNKQSDN